MSVEVVRGGFGEFPLCYTLSVDEACAVVFVMLCGDEKMKCGIDWRDSPPQNMPTFESCVAMRSLY
jgi:hypothetical protein